MKAVLIMLGLFLLFSCKDENSTPMDILDSTFHLQRGNNFSSISMSGSRDNGANFQAVVNDYQLNDGTFATCSLSGPVSLTNDYYTFFNATVISSGDEEVDKECEDAFEGETVIEARDELVKYTVGGVTYQLIN